MKRYAVVLIACAVWVYLLYSWLSWNCLWFLPAPEASGDDCCGNGAVWGRVTYPFSVAASFYLWVKVLSQIKRGYWK